MAKKVMRFPRLYLTSEMMVAEKIVRHIYNKLYEDRLFRHGKSRGDRFGWYDVYKTKRGIQQQAQVKFMMLGQDLVEKKIDPAVYVKVLAQYGKFQNSRYMPHPTWMASGKAIKVFKWMKKRSRQKFRLKSDWKKSLKLDNTDEIKQMMKTSAMIVRDVRKNFNLKLFEALIFLRDEISPWYWAVFLSLLKRKSRREEVLDFLWREAPDLRKAVILCTKYFLGHRPIWRMSCAQLQKYI